MKVVKAESSIIEAARDMRYLLNRGYTRKNSLSIVCSRYRVTGKRRRMLFRGVFDRESVEDRRTKHLGAEQIEGMILGVDWYNVLITVDSGLTGAVLVDSDDGFLRDIRGLHGKHPEGHRLNKATDRILEALSELSPSQLFFFLDQNVSKSGEMAGFLRDAAADIGTKSAVKTARTPDTLVSTKQVALSSDSVILDNSASAFDLPRHALSDVERAVAFSLR